MIISTAICGIPGVGKSVGARVKVQERMARRTRGKQRAALLFLDGPGETVEPILGDLCAAGREADVDYEELNARDRKHIGTSLLRPTGNRVTDELRVEQFLQPLYGQRGMVSGTNTPYIHKYAEAAAWVMMGLPETRIDAMLALFRLVDPEREWMLRHTTERDAAQVFRDASIRASIPRANPIQYEIETGGAARLFKPLLSPVIYEASIGNFDWKQFLLRGGIHLRNGKGVKREIRRFDSIMAINHLANAAWDLFNETGVAHDYYIVVEEGGADQIYTPQFLDNMRTARKNGWHSDFIFQSPADFGDVFEQFIFLVHRIECYRMTSGVKEMAQLLANPTWDSHKIHDEREVSYTQGYEEVDTETVSYDHANNKRVTHGRAFRPIQGVRIDKTYYNPQQHEAEFRQKLTTLKVGQRFVSDMDGVRLETVDMLPDPWPLGLTKIRTAKAIERIRSRPHYRKAEPWTPHTATQQPAGPQGSSQRTTNSTGFSAKRLPRRDATGELIGD
jgi:hypothetical protein